MSDFVKHIFSSNRDASFSRVAAQQALAAAIVWVSVIVFRCESKDFDKLPNIAIFIGACAAFFTSIYTVGKIQETKQAKDDKACPEVK